MPLPVMSKAEPWIGSNIDGASRSGLRLAVGAMPSEPASAAARSDRMSACRLVATIVSSVCGFIIMRMVIASTSILSQVTSGNSCATSAAISSHITMAWRCAFDLGDDRQQLARPGLRQLEGEADDALHAGAGHHRDVGGDLDRQPSMHAAANAGILALGILAHDHPVELRAG